MAEFLAKGRESFTKSANPAGVSSVYDGRMRIIAILTAVCFLAGTGLAQEKKRVSPHEKASIDLNGKTITIEYGRPYLKGRKAVGGTLVPYGKVWRTGADEATTLTTSGDLDIGGVSVPAGTYALFTLPSENGWKLIVSKNAKQWGAFSYKESEDLGRAGMTTQKLSSPVEQFTIALEPAGANKAALKLSWEETEASVPITAK
jgi:Protein of unknown function (DUF2911)